MAKKSKKVTNADIVAKAIGKSVDTFPDNSSSWITIESDKYVVSIDFDSTGEIFEGITVAEKIYQVVDEKVIFNIKV